MAADFARDHRPKRQHVIDAPEIHNEVHVSMMMIAASAQNHRLGIPVSAIIFISDNSGNTLGDGTVLPLLVIRRLIRTSDNMYSHRSCTERCSN